MKVKSGKMSALVEEKIFDKHVFSRPIRFWNPDGCWGVHPDWEPSWKNSDYDLFYFTIRESRDSRDDIEREVIEFEKEYVAQKAYHDKNPEELWYHKDEPDLTPEGIKKKWEETSYHKDLLFIEEFGITTRNVEKVRDWDCCYDTAFMLIEHIQKEWIFSKRQKFFNLLSKQIVVEGHQIAWPNALVYLKPYDIALAALKTVGCEVELDEESSV